MARWVQDPRGGEWLVRRRWLSRRHRLRGAAFLRPQPYRSGQGFALVLFLPFGLAWLLLTFVDLLRELAAHLGGKPWVIEAKLDALKEEHLTWRVAGWSQSRQAIRETVEALSRGDELTRFGEPERDFAQAVMQLRLEKSFVAPPERVFAAFVDPEQLRLWFGPVGFTVPALEVHAVEGGGYRIAMQPPEGAAFHIRGTFRTVEAPRRLAFTFSYEEPDPEDRDTLVTVAFEPAEQGTRVVLDQEPFETAARWTLHRDGWTESLERLEQVLV